MVGLAETVWLLLASLAMAGDAMFLQTVLFHYWMAHNSVGVPI
jgi:hypothetical protein